MDEAFLRTRGILRGKRLRIVLLSMIPAVFLSVFLWATASGSALWEDPADPQRMIQFTVWRAIVIAIQTVIGCWVAWWMFEKVRGPLPEAPGGAGLLARSLILAPLMVAWLGMAHVLVLGEALVNGDTAWIPGAWMDSLHRGFFLVVLAIGLLAWPIVQFAPVVMAVEGTGPFRSITKSLSLTLQSGGQVLGVSFTFLLLHIVLGGALSAAVGAFIGRTAMLAQDSDGMVLADGLLLSSGMLLAESFLTPHRTNAFLFAYLGVRVRRDGLDVIQAAHAAGLLPERPAA